MFQLFDFLTGALKFCFILSLVRLGSTAFNLEFGISRQYLKILELIFQFGQKRIEKVESRSRIQLNCTNAWSDSKQDSSDESSRPSINAKGEEQIRSSQAANLFALDETEEREFESNFKKNCSSSNRINDKSNDDFDGQHQANKNNECSILDNNTQNPDRPRKLGIVSNCYNAGGLSNNSIGKTRRISTPDGPPVFLLDEDEFLELNPNNNPNEGNRDKSANQGAYKHEFHLDDACKFIKRGILAVIDDEVTKRFTQEQLKTWNLLTRTNDKNYQFMSRSLGLYWFFGFLVRYLILLPLRIMFTLAGSIWLISSMALIGLLPMNLRDKPYTLMSLMSFRMLSCGITSRLKFHNQQFKAKKGDICVANHTSPIDAVLLACDNCYALVGQRHGGIIGILEYALSRATNHVWFDRSEMRDRQLVSQRLKEHVQAGTNLPILIFPEGTCINNSAVMMFRKGSFETTNKVCPVAIKYDPRFGDPFWNSSKHSYLQYLLLIMSSWAIKCDVWYLPPMVRLPDESSAEFANRVKAEIAKQGGLVDLAWDGQLKRSAAKEIWRHQQQEDFVNRLKIE